MSTKEKMSLFFEIHKNNLREGPGSFESTKKAFTKLKGLPQKPKILDIGCGPGQQTLDLASLSAGTITAVDNHKPYVEAFSERVKELGLSERISVVWGDMTALDFEFQSFDLIWAEGSIYIMGFENGLRRWKPMLKRGGYLAVSELTWLKSGAPERLKKYWSECYPAMKTIEENVRITAENGYKPVSNFELPESDWWDNYYLPLEKKISFLRQKYRNNDQALEVLSEEKREIDIFRRYSEYYGYVFYLAQLPE